MVTMIVRVLWTGIALVACGFIWLKTPGLFTGTFVSELSFLIPFAAVIIFLTLLNWLSGLAGREG